MRTPPPRHTKSPRPNPTFLSVPVSVSVSVSVHPHQKRAYGSDHDDLSTRENNVVGTLTVHISAKAWDNFRRRSGNPVSRELRCGSSVSAVGGGGAG